MKTKTEKKHSGTTKEIRDVFRITQEELSKLFEIPVSTIRNWDARKTMPDYIYNMLHAALGSYDDKMLRGILKYSDQHRPFDPKIDSFEACFEYIKCEFELYETWIPDIMIDRAYDLFKTFILR